MKKGRLRRRVVRIVIALTLIIPVGGYIVFQHIAPYAIIKPARANCSHLSLDAYDLQVESLTLETKDQIELKGYWIQSKQDSIRGVMILVHGIGGCKESFLSLANRLANQGIASVLFDNRAHGQSGGQYSTYGFYEKKDISRIIDHIKEQDNQIPIGIWGNSLGGAIAIQSMEYDKRIHFGIIESTFTDMGQIVYDYKKRFLKGFGLRFATDMALKRAGEIGDFNPDLVSPVDAVKSIEQPIFIAHGDADLNIKFAYRQQLYEQAKSADKEFYRVKDGGHYGLFDAGGEDYMLHIQQFIDRNLLR